MPRPARSAAAPVAAPVVAAVEEPVSGSSAERSLRLLALLAHEGRALSLADLAAQLGLPKGTAHRICTQLLATGFLARDLDERSFVVGPALRQLAFDTLNHGSVRGLRHEVLAALVQEVGETCNLTTLDGARVLYLDRVEAQWPLRLTLDVGSHVPLHCTASGKLFLAQMPKKARDAMIDGLPLPRMTASTLTDPAALRAECDAIAQDGFSRDREEFMAGLVAVAVPVRDAAGEVRAALAVHAPTARMSMADAERRIDALKAAALRMGGLL
ncbi:IclR family transcriptional regulator [Variovorax sp.]|jgi:IclR family transcriptional regulator, acetate operon repressor|uniref:IclR family transcriptional regulator n=1 Tax=Variovorax sp. TaxID=1871043 RepID=UPI0011F97496|nr:IclR family transcriptional regulator [Variovorax sp.]TAJ67356.1 MAG: IclR family transcriptional regulator [Variovorax sp.]